MVLEGKWGGETSPALGTLRPPRIFRRRNEGAASRQLAFFRPPKRFETVFPLLLVTSPQRVAPLSAGQTFVPGGQVTDGITTLVVVTLFCEVLDALPSRSRHRHVRKLKAKKFTVKSTPLRTSI